MTHGYRIGAAELEVLLALLESAETAVKVGADTWAAQAVAEISNIVARARSGEEDAEAFRLLQHHAMDIGQRRVEQMLELAELERES